MVEKEYIERGKINDYISELREYVSASVGLSQAEYSFISDILTAFENFPAADVEPVRHGRWKKSKGNERPTENGFVHDDRYVCDCCGWGCCCETKLDFSFCPNCGAKMGGEVE